MEDKNPNLAGKTYVAKVKVKEAVPFDSTIDVDPEGNPKHFSQWAALSSEGANPSDPKTWNTLKAENFEPDKNGHLKFFCSCCLAEKGDLKGLKKPTGKPDPTGGRKGHYGLVPFILKDRDTGKVVMDEETQKPKKEFRRYFIEPYYPVLSGVRHSCDSGPQQNTLSQRAADNRDHAERDQGGDQSDEIILNLNIPAGQKPISIATQWPEPGMTKTSSFERAARSPLKRELYRSKSNKPPQSRNVKEVDTLAKALEEGESNQDKPKKRYTLRNGEQKIPLKEAFHATPVSLYSDLHGQAKAEETNGQFSQNHIRVFRFRPIGHKKFWHRQKDGSVTIESMAEKVTGEKGRTFYISTKLNFRNETVFDAFQQMYNAAQDKDERRFLVYTEHARVNLNKNRDIRRKVANKELNHGTLHVQAKVSDMAQIIQWPPPPQMSLGFDDPNEAEQKPDTESEIFPTMGSEL